VSAVELHYEAAGSEDAPLLLLGSSIGATSAMWDAQAGPLSARHRVVRFDHRGHGRSPVPAGPYALDDLGADVLALADRLGAERFAYAGLSLGGMLGMWLAINAADRVDRIALLCTSPYMPPASMWDERIAAIEAAGSVEAIADATLERWLTPDFTDAHPEVRERLRAMLVATPVAGYAGCAAAIRDMDLRAGLPGIAAPTLVIAGSDDPSTPAEDHAQVIADAIPGARLEIVEPAAHIAAVEQAEAVTRLISDFLGEDR
jgi:3-oxoadipate enol-lactonase